MAFNPKHIKPEHIQKAINRVTTENIDLKSSNKYAVKIKNKYYPPKEIMRYARFEFDGVYDWPYSGGEQTNKYLNELGFEVVDKTDSREALITTLIENYKAIVENEGLSSERYKWELVKENKGCPNIRAIDFATEMSKLDMSNLVYELVRPTIKHILESQPEEYRKCIAILLNDNKNLNLRLETMDHELTKLYRTISSDEKRKHQHDERTASVLLTYYNPDKYTFYKESYYMKYCKYLGIQHIKTKGEKYSHYLELIEELSSYLSQDKELIHKVESQLKDNSFPDKKHLILAQDILYQYFDSTQRTLKSEKIELENQHLQQPLNQILYGPPGTGKTYSTVNKAISIINPDFDLTQDRMTIKEEYHRLIENGSIRFITFHQSFSYEDFVEGIKPKTISEIDEKGNEKLDIVYEIKDGVFKQLCMASYISKCNLNSLIGTYIGKNRITNVSNELLTIEKSRGGNLLIPLKLIEELVAYIAHNKINFSDEKQVIYNDSTGDRKKFPNLEPYMVNGYKNIYPDLVDVILKNIKEDYNQNYVLIIDEINRGNIASIFGELITLIEEDKREGKDEALSTILPYSKEKFCVPSNVYLLGTMNTADRSVEALDIALRRRFSFIEMTPNTELLNFQIEDINIKDLVEIINLRIEKLLDKDHKIGHAYFMSIKNLKDLIYVFKNKVIPLLEEYFFGDYSKIGLILGKNFVERVEFDSDLRFADFENDEQTDLLDRPIYELTDSSDWDFSSIL